MFVLNIICCHARNRQIAHVSSHNTGQLHVILRNLLPFNPHAFSVQQNMINYKIPSLDSNLTPHSIEEEELFAETHQIFPLTSYAKNNSFHTLVQINFLFYF